MLYKKDILMIDSDTTFVNKIEKRLNQDFNFLSTDNLKTAFLYCGMSPTKLEIQPDAIIQPSMIVFGDGINLPDNLLNSIQNNLPQIHDQKAFDNFLPVYYSKLFSNYFKQTKSNIPSTCICIDSSSYKLNGEFTQDIAKLLECSMQNNIPLIQKTPEREKLVLASLQKLVQRKCSISKGR